jgi:hypothetical protein
MTPIRSALRAATSAATTILALLGGCAKNAPVVTVPVPAPETQSQARRGNSESVHVLGIPPGQLPRAGQCRVWVQGVPPGHQARSRSCAGIASTAPAGSWIVYRPADSRDIHVHVVDRSRPGQVVLIRHYNAEGEWLRDEQPGDHHDEDANEGRGRGRGRRRS